MEQNRNDNEQLTCTVTVDSVHPRYTVLRAEFESCTVYLKKHVAGRIYVKATKQALDSGLFQVDLEEYHKQRQIQNTDEPWMFLAKI